MDHNNTNKGKLIILPKFIVTNTYIYKIYPFTNPSIGLILYICIYIDISIIPKKRNLIYKSIIYPISRVPKINYKKKIIIIKKNNYKKTGQFSLIP